MIVGESLIGVIIAVIIVISVTSGGGEDPLSMVGKDFANTAEWLGLGVFILTIAYFVNLVLSTKFNREEALEIQTH